MDTVKLNNGITVPRYTEISDKNFYFIVTAADTGESSLQLTIEVVRGFTEDCLLTPMKKVLFTAPELGRLEISKETLR